MGGKNKSVGKFPKSIFEKAHSKKKILYREKKIFKRTYDAQCQWPKKKKQIKDKIYDQKEISFLYEPIGNECCIYNLLYSTMKKTITRQIGANV